MVESGSLMPTSMRDSEPVRLPAPRSPQFSLRPAGPGLPGLTALIRYLDRRHDTLQPWLSEVDAGTMKLHPFVIAWLLCAAAGLAARWGFAEQWSGRVALAYAIGSGFVVVLMTLAYRRRLRQFLRTERRDVWRSLHTVSGDVPTFRMLAWGLSNADRSDPEIQAARTTGSYVLVIVITWLMSTPVACLLLSVET